MALASGLTLIHASCSMASTASDCPPLNFSLYGKDEILNLFWQSTKLKALVPLAGLALVLAACSPGGATTPAAIFGGTVTGGSTYPSDYIKLNGVFVNTGGLTLGYIAGQLMGGSHFISYNLSGGFFDLSGNECSVYPCPEGGEFGSSGNASLYAPMSTTPIAYSYSLDSFDYDNASGTQYQPDTIRISLCPGYGNGFACFFISIFTENFSCTDPGFIGGGGSAFRAAQTTVASGVANNTSCYEITLRPGNFGGAAAHTRANLIQSGKSIFH